MKYCIKCGELLKKENQFCDHCGAKQPHIEENSGSQHFFGLNKNSPFFSIRAHWQGVKFFAQQNANDPYLRVAGVDF